ncbi:MAG: ATP-binding protein [Lachnospiraceae bacterium]|nr:ATP-binding protein [Lachnospiraceae bacterium]
MQKIGIGYEDYREFIDSDMYFVDKTLLIRDVIEKGGKTTLFTRPRRFGKTLALSMLRTFFELEYDRDGNIIEKKRYFEGKKIMEAGEDILSKMGKYPVIKLSLKSAKQPDFRLAGLRLRDEIVSEFRRHGYLRDSKKLDAEEKQALNPFFSPLPDLQILDEAKAFAEIGRYATSLKVLSDCLAKHHETKVIILLDEYDVPLENAYFTGFYDEMTGFIRSLFESALKTNDALELAVVTGCLRISRESIFTGLNNLEINLIHGESFGEYFGFTQQETEDMLIAYGLKDKIGQVRDWYDGYLFGKAEVYNPWSVIKYVKDHRESPEAFPRPYWSNTSSNSIIKELVYKADEDMKKDLERLIEGGTIEKRIHEDITYGDIDQSEDNLWNFLYFTGYMKKVSERFEDDKIYLTMCIPNREVRSIYSDQISTWFEKIVKNTDRQELYQAVISKDTDRIAGIFTALLEKSISTFDCIESFYHGFALSMLLGMPAYEVRSNREEGLGRPEIILYPVRPKDPAYIFELKVRKKFNEMQDGIEEAFTQIRDRKYEEGVLEDGYIGAVSFAVCFCKKSCILELYSQKK